VTADTAFRFVARRGFSPSRQEIRGRADGGPITTNRGTATRLPEDGSMCSRIALQSTSIVRLKSLGMDGRTATNDK